MKEPQKRSALVRKAIDWLYPFARFVGRKLVCSGVRLLGWEDLIRLALPIAPGSPKGASIKRVLGWIKRLPLKQRLELRRHLDLPQRMDYERRDILLSLSSIWEKMRLRSVAKEPWTVEWIETMVRPGDVFYDIGANVGAYSLIAAKSTDGQARVVAFEPGFASFASLCKNIVLNGCQDSITPLPIALSRTTGLDCFKYSDISAGAALHAVGNAAPGIPGGNCPVVYEQPILVYSLDDFVARFGLPQPNHIKLDVDGNELQVLRGAVEVLTDPALKSVLMEVEDAHEEDLVQEMESLGLRLVQKYRRTDAKADVASVWYGVFERARSGVGDEGACAVASGTPLGQNLTSTA